MRALMAYPWPGNVRELRNVIERALILSDGPVITLRGLPAEVLGQSAESSSTDLRHAVRDYETSFIRNILREFGWNKEATARKLGINASTLYRKMSDLGIDDPSHK